MGNNIGMEQLGQYGSAYTDIAQLIIPPKDMVIVAIHFLAANTPTVLTPEKLDTGGPSYASIAANANVVLATAENDQNFRGVHASAIGNVTDAAAGTEHTLTTPPTPRNTIQIGQYVLLANTAADNDGSTPMELDISTTNGCPIPTYSGPNKQGVRVIGWDGATKVKVDANITASTQSFIFLDEFHGAGGITSVNQAYPANSTIYGRWTAVMPSSAGTICYFGY